MNFHFPDLRALCMAENATHTLHNLLTLRGALVRDPHVWAHYLDRGDRAVRRPTPTWCSPRHHWPTWGTERHHRVPVASSATCTPTCTTRPCGCSTRAAPGRRSPRRSSCRPRWREAWHTPRLLRLGQPQRQGRLPALHGLVRRQPGPPVGAPAGRVGAPATSSSWAAPTRCWRKARESFAAGDYRWVAEVVNHVIFADPDNAEAQRAAGRRATSSSATAPRTGPGATST